MRSPKPVLIAGALAVLALGGLAVAVAAPRAAGKAETILPGQWEYSYRIGPIPAGKEDRCLKQADVEQFAKGICTRRYTCNYETRTVQDGKVALKGTWTDKKGRVAPVTANGTYTTEAFRLNVHMKTINGLPLAGVMDARRTSAICAPD
jgi:hypothetical protein